MRMTYIRNGLTLRLDSDACNGCGRCIEVCPHQVLVMANRRARIADRAACMECGACANNCETEAIKVRSGVGCASAVIRGMLRGKAPQCGCGEVLTSKKAATARKTGCYG